jgi:5'-deoxynucleotidase YfbR-like HD superfamily hydrolase
MIIRKEKIMRKEDELELLRNRLSTIKYKNKYTRGIIVKLERQIRKLEDLANTEYLKDFIKEYEDELKENEKIVLITIKD